MKRGLPLLLLATLCACQGEQFKETIKQLPQGGTATDSKTGIVFTFNQKNAGSPGADGWYAATSLPCGFRVDLPGPYNDFSQTMPSTDGATIRVHVVGARTIEGAKFTATCTERSDNKIPLSWKEDVVAGFRADNPDMKQQPATLGGADGIQYSIRESRTAAIGRLASIDNRAYQLIVEYPRSEDEYMPQLAEMFFSSFQSR